MTFYQKLDNVVKKNNSLVCVGLDSDFIKLPDHIKKDKTPQFTFNKAIIDATHDLVCAYKPNTAFYEARGAQGVRELKMTCDYLTQNYPRIVIIIDAKRADIGNTNEAYAQYVFDYLNGDAVTLQPYLGKEALTPFLDRKEKGSFILCRTSNSGAGEMQDLKVGAKPLYQVVARMVATKWNGNRSCGLVVGATYPGELGIVRRIVGDMPILVPGIGAQSGDIEQTIKMGLGSRESGLIINVSRTIIFASNTLSFAQAARAETQKLKALIQARRVD